MQCFTSAQSVFLGWDVQLRQRKGRERAEGSSCLGHAGSAGQVMRALGPADMMGQEDAVQHSSSVLYRTEMAL